MCWRNTTISKACDAENALESFVYFIHHTILTLSLSYYFYVRSHLRVWFENACIKYRKSFSRVVFNWYNVFFQPVIFSWKQNDTHLSLRQSSVIHFPLSSKSSCYPQVIYTIIYWTHHNKYDLRINNTQQRSSNTISLIYSVPEESSDMRSKEEVGIDGSVRGKNRNSKTLFITENYKTIITVSI
jgi:hypothetical protein